MGNKVSAIHGVKSADFYNQGNAINEIWIGDVELVSRLPFGDSDLGQAGWPKGSWPKIPWHQFIVPLRRSIDIHNDTIMAANETAGNCPGKLGDIWPNTGFFSGYRNAPKPVAYIFGTVLFAFGLFLSQLPAHRRDEWRRDLSLFQRIRLRAASMADIERLIKVTYWSWMLWTILPWTIGIVVSFLSLPLWLWSAQDMTFLEIVVGSILSILALLICSGLILLYDLVWLFILRRRALAAQQQATIVDEKTAEECIPVTTVQEFWGRVKHFSECPHCERNCYCKIR